MRWFKHISRSYDDQKLSRVVDAFGLEGYGFWWRMVEIIADDMDSKRVTSVTFSLKKWGSLAGISPKKWQRLAEFCQNVGLFSVKYFGNSEKFAEIDMPNILKYRDEYSKKSGQTPDKLRTNSGQTPDTYIDTDTEAEIERELRVREMPSASCSQPPGESVELPSGEDMKHDESKANSPPECPHDKILELYHVTLPELPKAKTWPEHRRKLLRSRWRETWERARKAGKGHEEVDLLAWWKAYFMRVRASPFLMGQVSTNGREFYATLEWLLRPTNYAKVLDGNYLGRK